MVSINPALPVASAERAAVEAPPAAIPVLTGLRFVAAFSVVIAHAVSTVVQIEEAPNGAIYWLKQASGFGMTLFFVLSGFVIHYNYRGLVTAGGLAGIGHFLWARFARLYPLFIAMLAVNVLLSSRTRELLGGNGAGFRDLLAALPAYLMFAQSWFYHLISGVPLASAIGGGSPITWSISTEWFFYLAYPALAPLVLLIRRPLVLAVAAFAWCAAWAMLAATLFDNTAAIDAFAVERFGADAGIARDVQSSFVRWLLYLSPYVRIGEFVLGCLMAELYRRLDRKPPSDGECLIGNAVLLLALASVVAVTCLMYHPDHAAGFARKLDMNFGLAPSAALVIFCAARYAGPLQRLLATRPVIALGDASYSLYLIHYVAFMIVLRAGFAPLSAPTGSVALEIARLLGILAVVFALSLASYALIESPARRWLRGLWDQGRRDVVLIVAASPVLAAVLLLAAL